MSRVRHFRKSIATIVAVSILAAGLTLPARPAQAIPEQHFGIAINNVFLLGMLFMSSYVTCLGSMSCNDPLTYGEADGNGLDGDMLLWDVAVPWQLSEQVTVGVIGGIGDMDTKWKPFALSSDTDVTLGGGFIVFHPDPATRIRLEAFYSDLDTDFSILGSSGSADSHAMTWKGEVARRIDMEGYWLEPSVRLTYMDGKRGSFVDTLFGASNPASDIDMFRVAGALSAGMPIPAGHECTGISRSCRPGEMFARVSVFHDDFSGTGVPAGLPASLKPDDEYVGIEAAVGALVPVSDYVSVGANAMLFDAGDFDGYGIQGVLNIDLQGLVEAR